MSVRWCSCVRTGCQAMHFLWSQDQCRLCLLLGQQVLHCHSLATRETQGLHNGGRSQLTCSPAILPCSSLQRQPLLPSSLLLLRLMHQQAACKMTSSSWATGVPIDTNVASCRRKLFWRDSCSPRMLAGPADCHTAAPGQLMADSLIAQVA